MLLLKMADIIRRRKVIITMFLIFIFIFCFPSMGFSQSFRTLELPPKVTAPESFAFERGTRRFYVSVADGRILQYNGPTGGFRKFGFTSPTRSKAVCDGTTNPDLGPICGRPLGLGFHYSSNRLYVCEAYLGLMVLRSAGKLATPLSTSADGQPYHLCNGLHVHQLSGNVFFTDSSTVYDLRNASKGINTNDTTGRLLMYDPDTKNVTVLLKNLAGPAGVAVSQDGSYALVSNFNSNNTIRFWLQGPRTGSYDIINSQERSNNIRITPVGDFWEAAATVKQPAQKLEPIGQRLNGFGRVIQTVNFEPWYGNKLISEVQEFLGDLYVASPSMNFIGIYSRL